MKKLALIIAVVIVAGAIYGAYRYGKQAVKPAASPAANNQPAAAPADDIAVTSIGYHAEYNEKTNPDGSSQIEDLVFVSPEGKRHVVPKITAALISAPIRLQLHYNKSFLGQFITSLYMPTVPLMDPDMILLSTYDFEGQASQQAVCSEGKSTIINRILSYNFRTQQLNQVYQEQIDNSTAAGVKNCHEVDTLGRQAMKLIVLFKDPDSSPGPCVSPWLDSQANLKYLDLTNTQSGFKSYAVPQYKLDEEKLAQDSCHKQLQAN
jgi:hypothetical protein